MGEGSRGTDGCIPKTAAGDAATRENIYKYLSIMDKLDEFVGRTIASGEIDKRALDKLAHDRKQGFLGLGN